MPKQQNFQTINNAIVWCEIPVSDLEKGRVFYEALLQGEMQGMQMGPDMTYILPRQDENVVAGNIVEGKPAAPGTGNTLHLALPDNVEAAMKRVEAAGGKVVSQIIEIPEGRFAYCLDPDGNSISIFSRANRSKLARKGSN